MSTVLKILLWDESLRKKNFQPPLFLEILDAGITEAYIYNHISVYEQFLNQSDRYMKECLPIFRCTLERSPANTRNMSQ